MTPWRTDVIGRQWTIVLKGDWLCGEGGGSNFYWAWGLRPKGHKKNGPAVLCFFLYDVGNHIPHHEDGPQVNLHLYHIRLFVSIFVCIFHNGCESQVNVLMAGSIHGILEEALNLI